ncbi:Predicted arabinose efflux permease, MFS family [Micromonospora purpureochromogenes]|uniref:Predicted arabinose efflux permease, MFS family n=1 Tax=Micromonospora purpureochromogenes TaxID=47872 RepID=A0A1C4Z1Y2_9ACTN|nr:MFS transporter [Micromonospora purpureochromogenes]SCF27052.1 Predicted arabinose efflux permease, MFS family [Micromonospora purpureochromogenes]
MTAVSSPRLGPDFARLWTASAVANLGDGVTMIAGPLLVASISDDPAAVAAAAVAPQLPWLLFALVSGALVDRFDRRRLVVAVNLARGAVLAALAVAVLAGAATVPLICLAFFLTGVGETLADTASGALLPALVPAEQLERANGRLFATFVLGNQFAAKPLGAYLFGLGAALPFAVDAASFGLAALLVALLRWRPTPPAGPTPDGGARHSLRADVAAGLRALWSVPVLRSLAVCIAVMNVAFCAAFAAFVLYARQRLGLGDVGYGVLLTASAVGGLAGTALAGRLKTRFGAPALLRVGLLVEVGLQLVLATTRQPWIAGAALAVWGGHAMIWGVLVVSLRQRLVPDRLRGRVNSGYALADLGGAAVGTALGGLLAQATGAITAPFWMAAGALTVLTVAVWRRLAAAG